MTASLKDKITPDEMVAICWLYATVRRQECKCQLFIDSGDTTTTCVRCSSMQYAHKAWPHTITFIEDTTDGI